MATCLASSFAAERHPTDATDRTNVGNARLFGAEADMGLSSTDWNQGLTVFFITYALAGPPSNVALKRFGPRIVLPTLLLCVSFVLIGSGCAHSKAQWLALRLLLGTFEAGTSLLFIIVHRQRTTHTLQMTVS